MHASSTWEDLDTFGKNPSADVFDDLGGRIPLPDKEIRRATVQSVMAQCMDMASILRLLGAVTVIAAMSAFLLQGWSGARDMSRFYLLLSQTGLLAAGGFGLSYLMKENKGARVFFSLGLLSIISNVATLGALIFSMVQWSGSLAHYPAFTQWKATSMADLGLAMACGLTLMVPVAYFGFMVLARRSARSLLGLFLLMNVLLVLPVRGTGLVGLIAAAAILVPLLSLPRLTRRDPTLRTLEGCIAVATLFAPALIIVARNFFLYQMDDISQMLLAGTAYATLRCALPSYVKHRVGLFDGLAGLALGALAVHPMAHMLSMGSDPLFHLLFAYGFAGLGLDVARCSEKSAKPFATFTTLVFAGSLGISLLDNGGTLNSLLFIFSGLGAVVVGRMLSHRAMLIVGGIMAGLGLVHLAYRIIEHVDFFNWITLAVLGTTTIVAASVIERHGAVIKLRWQQLDLRME